MELRSPMVQLPCLSAACPLLAVPPRRRQWHGPRGGVRRPNAAGSGVAGVRAAAAVEAEVDDEDEEERYALGGACKVLAGMPAPLGATALAGGVNFAVYSGGATAAALCLFTPEDLNASRVTEEVPLDPLVNRTGNVWHVFIQGEQLHTMLYGYRFDGVFAPERGQYYDVSNVVVDPYAKAVISRGEYGVPATCGNCWPQMAGMVPLPYNTFDWQGDLPLRYHQKDLVIYEIHLRGFTKHGSSNIEHPGTYIGAVSKLDYLKGVPMFYMGDEYGHTKGGNNNTYCHDHYVNYFRWDKEEEQSADLYRFCRLMTKFRKECESLGLEDFPTAERLQWHGHQPGKPDWSEASRFVAFSMRDETKGEIYVAFNTSHLPVIVRLPERPGYRWEPVVDTGKPAPYDFLTDGLPDCAFTIHQFSHFLNSNLYPMLSYSSIILVLRPEVYRD